MPGADLWPGRSCRALSLIGAAAARRRFDRRSQLALVRDLVGAQACRARTCLRAHLQGAESYRHAELQAARLLMVRSCRVHDLV